MVIYHSQKYRIHIQKLHPVNNNTLDKSQSVQNRTKVIIQKYFVGAVSIHPNKL
jgi:hypothetical protein